ncbi:MAG: GNAT family N-acetyltransferase [Candidatus ainarchaeum sp.]|nr:GNAT family N-acetyltransferase [Candidatus ainarchaeum sp.]
MIRIRKMRRTELGRARLLAHAIFPRSVVKIDAGDTVLLAEAGKMPVGFVHIKNERGRLLLCGMGVAASMRGQGIGTLLMEKAMELMAASGKPVYLKVKAMNKAVNLYARYGFFVMKFGRAHVLVKKPNS